MLNDEYKNRLLNAAQIPLLRIWADSKWFKAHQKETEQRLTRQLTAKLSGCLRFNLMLERQGIAYQMNAERLQEVQQLSDQDLFDQLFDKE